MAFWAEVIPMTNLCDVCGKPATQSMLRDLFGKSDEMRFVCSDHGFRIRDPADVAAIDQLHAALKTAQELAATRLMEVERQKAALVEAWNETHTASIEIERLRGEAEVADEQLAQLRGFAEAHKNCRGSDEPCEQRGPFAGLQSLSFDVSENPTIALVMRFDNIEHAQAARDQLWQPAGASRDASAGEAAEVQK
jgi:hypothetical protein